MRPLLASVSAALVLAAAGAGAADAQTAHRDWEAHARGDVCYSVSFPKGLDAGANPASYVVVTQRSAEGIKDEIGFVSGLASEGDITGRVSIDGKEAKPLLVHDGAGFVSSREEPALLKDMIRGIEMKVTWSLENGDRKVDTYSLLGFTASHGAAKASCR